MAVQCGLLLSQSYQPKTERETTYAECLQSHHSRDEMLQVPLCTEVLYVPSLQYILFTVCCLYLILLVSYFMYQN